MNRNDLGRFAAVAAVLALLVWALLTIPHATPGPVGYTPATTPRAPSHQCAHQYPNAPGAAPVLHDCTTGKEITP